MDVYAYQAALLCEECGDKVIAKLTAEGKAPAEPENENTFDSDQFPKGPYAHDSNESDSIQHCDHCGVFLENPLTNEGYNSLYEMVRKALNEGRCSEALREWIDFYDVDLKSLLDNFCPKTESN
jgi:hypothetical protein